MSKSIASLKIQNPKFGLLYDYQNGSNSPWFLEARISWYGFYCIRSRSGQKIILSLAKLQMTSFRKKKIYLIINAPKNRNADAYLILPGTVKRLIYLMHVSDIYVHTWVLVCIMCVFLSMFSWIPKEDKCRSMTSIWYIKLLFRFDMFWLTSFGHRCWVEHWRVLISIISVSNHCCWGIMVFQFT